MFPKDKDTFNTLELEMNLRNTLPILISCAQHPVEFIVDPENADYIIPPFTSSIDGLGENVADTVVEARKQGPSFQRRIYSGVRH